MTCHRPCDIGLGGDMLDRLHSAGAGPQLPPSPPLSPTPLPALLRTLGRRRTTVSLKEEEAWTLLRLPWQLVL